jgi:hypothetical protein
MLHTTPDTTVRSRWRGSRPFFARKLPTNISKIQDIIPQMAELFCKFGLSPAPSKFLDPPQGLIVVSVYLDVSLYLRW